MTYKVGQVVYVVLRKQAVIYPVQIVEEITKRDINGSTTAYMVRAGAGAKSVVSIDSIDGELFDTSEAARLTLVDRASSAIASRVEQAVAKAKQWYPSGFEARADALAALVSDDSMHGVRSEVAELTAELRDESTVVELDSGAKVKVKSVKLPDVLR